MNEIVAFIFARGGSKGLPRKNILNFCGKPLIAWSIEQAKSSTKIDRLIVSTDCNEIAEIAKYYGAEVPFIRPTDLAQDHSPEWLAWRHAINFVKEESKTYPSIMVSVPTTSPLRSVNDIDTCIDLFVQKKPDAVITVTDARRNPYFNMVRLDDTGHSVLACQPDGIISTRQQSPNIYDMTTVAYVVKPEFVMEKDSLFEGKVYHVNIPCERGLDIDTKIDFDFAEMQMKQSWKGKF